MRSHRFSVLDGSWAVVRLEPEAPLPGWALTTAGFSAVVRTRDELSIVCAEALVPEGARADPGWAVVAVEGPLPFSEVGVLVSFASPLSAAGISCLAIGTFDTDYLLVKTASLAAACAALVRAGHILTSAAREGS